MTPDPAFTVQLSDRHRSPIGAGSRNPAESSTRHRTILKRRKLFGLVLPLAFLASQTLAATYTVTNLKDSGPGSLRAAILTANANQGSSVAFAVSGTINLSSTLPTIATQMTIDGSTAPGFSKVSEVPVVSLNFNFTPGLTVAADASTIKSLSLVHALNAAITLLASKVTVQGNYIGVQTDGSASGNAGDGVKILSPSGANLIGNSNPVSGVPIAI
jgi:hypothetical protein